MKVPKKLILPISDEFVAKLDAIGYNETIRQEMQTVIENHIENLYLQLKEKTKGITVKDLLEEELPKAKEFNDEHHNTIITENDLLEIQKTGLKKFVKGLTVTCPIENDLVSSYKITTNEKVRKYTSASNNWRTVESYNIYINTNKGDFVYISAINTVKTLKNYKDYQKKGLKYI